MTDVMHRTGQEGSEMSRHLEVARTPEELTPPAEIARGVLIYEDYTTDEGTRLVRGIASIAGAKVHFTDESPLGIIDHEPFVIFPGFGGIKPGYKKLRHELAASGRRAVSYAPPRRQGLMASMHPNHLFAPEKLTSKAGYAVARYLLRDEEVNGLHLAGHSMGGPIATEVAAHKEGILSVTLLGSAGLEDHDMMTMGKRMPGFILHELIPALPMLRDEFNPSAVGHIAEYGLFNPYLTFGEVRQVSGADARPTIRHLGKLGVAVNVVQMEDDHLFIESNVHNQSSKLVDRYVVLTGNHLKPQLDPEETANTILELQAA